MSASKLNFISVQSRSRIIKIISYLSKGEFKDNYNPKNILRTNATKSQEQFKTAKFTDNIHFGESNYQPSFINPQELTKSRSNQVLQKKTNYGNSPTLHNQQAFNNHKAFDDKQFFHNAQNINQSFRNSREDQYRISKNNSNQHQNYNTNKNQQENIPFKMNNTNINASNTLINDYAYLLSQNNNQEILCFAVQNIEMVLDDVIDPIIDNRDIYLKILNLIEINLPYEYQQKSIKILEKLSQNLTQTRAVDGLQNQIINRIVKAFSLQPDQFQPVLISLLQNHLSMGKYRVDISAVMSMIHCPYPKIQEVGAKILSILSDPNIGNFSNYDIQFENHIPFLIESTLSRKKSLDFKNYTIQALAHLALKESLRPQILYHNGVEVLLFHLRNDHNLEGQRNSAKALLNLCINSRDTKIQIVTELGEEIKKMQNCELDSIVTGYLETLIHSRGK